MMVIILFSVIRNPFNLLSMFIHTCLEILLRDLNTVHNPIKLRNTGKLAPFHPSILFSDDNISPQRNAIVTSLNIGKINDRLKS